MRCLAATRPYTRRLVAPSLATHLIRTKHRAAPAAAASLRILVRTPRLAGVHPDNLGRTAILALRRAAPHVVGDFGIALVNDKKIRELNRRYRAHDTPTDVLSFPLSDGQQAHEPFGDVIISYETARRQARAYGASLQREIQRLLIHGTLHLCGHDHHEPRAAARMHALTRRLLRAAKDV